MKNLTKFLLIIVFTTSCPNIVQAYANENYIEFVTEELPSDSKANMELVLSDFFNLLLTEEERDILRTEALKNIKITGYYKGTKDVKDVTYRVHSKSNRSIGIPTFLTKTRYKREINLKIDAIINNISIEENKVTFSLPVRAGKRNLFELYAIDIGGDLEHLADKYPKTNLDFSNLPRHHHIKTGYMMHRHHFLIDVEPAAKTVSGQHYRVDKYYYPSRKGERFPVNGWILQLNSVGDTKLGVAQVKAPLSDTNQFVSDDMYHYYDTSQVSSYDRNNAYYLRRPSDDILPPMWQGLTRVYFNYNILGDFDESYHKKQDDLVEVAVLEAEIPYITKYGWRASTKGKAEKWTAVHGKLTGINGGADANDAYDNSVVCHNVKYKIIYAPNGKEYKFFSHRYSNGDVQIINNDVTELQKLRDEFTTIYNEPEVHGEYYTVCQRRFDDAIYVLTAPRETLEKEFESYKKLIKKG